MEISVEPGTAVTKFGSTFTTPHVATTRVRGVLPECFDADVAARERELRRGEERVLAQVDRRGARVRGLPDELQVVALDAHGAEHHRRPASSSTRAPAPARCGARGTPSASSVVEVRPRGRHAVERDAVLRERVGQLDALRDPPGARAPCAHRARPRRPPSPVRLRPKRAPSSSAQSTRCSVSAGVALRLLAAQHLEAGEHAEAAVEPAAAGHRVEVAAEDDAARGARRAAWPTGFPRHRGAAAMPSSVVSFAVNHSRVLRHVGPHATRCAPRSSEVSAASSLRSAITRRADAFIGGTVTDPGPSLQARGPALAGTGGLGARRRAARRIGVPCRPYACLTPGSRHISLSLDGRT